MVSVLLLHLRVDDLVFRGSSIQSIGVFQFELIPRCAVFLLSLTILDFLREPATTASKNFGLCFFISATKASIVIPWVSSELPLTQSSLKVVLTLRS